MKEWLRRLGAIGLGLMTYSVVCVATFLYGETWSSNAVHSLAWIPALTAAAVALLVLLLGRRARGAFHTWVDGILAVSLTLAALAVGVILSGMAGGWTHAAAPSLAGDQFVRCGEVSLFVHQSEASGAERPSLIVLHGGPGSGSVGARARLGDALEERFHVRFFDQRGVGRSSQARSFRMEDYVADLECLRSSLGIESTYLLGISWGAAIANEYALLYPAQVRGVINWGGLVASQPESRVMAQRLSDTFRRNGEDGQAEKYAHLAQSGPFSRLQTVLIVDRVNRLRLKTVRSPEVELENIRAARRRAQTEWDYRRDEANGSMWATFATFLQNRLENYDFRANLPKLRVPYLFMQGREDPEMDAQEIARYVQVMPRARSVWIERSSHVLDCPEEMVREIAAFVDQVESESNLGGGR